MKIYKRVIRKNNTTGALEPYIEITETRTRKRYMSVKRLQAKRLETQRMLDA